MPTDNRVGALIRLTLLVLVASACGAPDDVSVRTLGTLEQAASSPVCAPPPGGIVAWWAGDGNANDVRGVKNGAFAGSYSTGIVREAFSITPTAYVTVPDAPDLNPTQISVEAWFRRDAYAWFDGADPVVKKAGNGFSPEGGYSLEFGNFGGSSRNQVFFYVYTGGTATGAGSPGWQSSPGATVANGQWAHAVGVYDGSQVGLYLDGALVGFAPATGAIVGATSPLEIGRAPENESASAFSGLIDEVTVYNRALTASEIRTIFDAGSAGKCKCDPAAPIEVNGYELRGDQEHWVRYVASDVVPSLQGPRKARIESAATAAWWALKEGVLSRPQFGARNPHRFSLCSWPGRGDIDLRPIQTCPARRAWQVGLAGVQVPNYSDLQVWAATQALWPARTTTEILGEAAVLAGFQPNRGPTYAAIVSSEGVLQRSWLLRHPVVGVTMQAPVVTAECVVGAMRWCYGRSWIESRRFAPDRDGALQSIEDLTTAFECLAP